MAAGNWVRESLLDKTLGSKVEAMLEETAVLREAYAVNSLLRDGEANCLLLTLIQGLTVITFDFASPNDATARQQSSVSLEQFTRAVGDSERARCRLEAKERNVEIWKIDFHDMRLGTLIGRGGFGEVYRGTWRGTDVAIKMLLEQNVEQSVLDAFCDEVSLMRQLRHPQIVLFMGASLTPGKLAIVTEFLPRLSLFAVLHDASVELPPQLKLSMLADVARGMTYLHSNSPPVLHLDLKSLNLLVDTNFRVKVADFGLSTFKKHLAGVTSNQAMGTVHWMAPEYLATGLCDEKADVYSFGIVMWEVVTRDTPYADVDVDQLAPLVVNEGLRPDIPPDAGRLATIMPRLWHADSHQRPTFIDVLDELLVAD